MHVLSMFFIVIIFQLPIGIFVIFYNLLFDSIFKYKYPIDCYRLFGTFILLFKFLTGWSKYPMRGPVFPHHYI